MLGMPRMGDQMSRPCGAHGGKQPWPLIGVPFLLLAIGHVRHTRWTRLSNDGQASGSTAKVLGMFAPVGSRRAADALQVAGFNGPLSSVTSRIPSGPTR